MKIGLVQAKTWDDRALNLTTIREYAEKAALEGCSALCFPECFLTSYAPEKAAELAISAEDGILKEVSSIAADCALDLLVGFMERDGEVLFIAHGLFRRDGSRECYRKTHLGEKEKKYFLPGDKLKVLSLTDETKIGISLCVENHYPQVAQTLALRGAEIIFAPHAVPKVAGEREKIWSKYMPARSYDNRVYTACCNLWDGERFGGGCLVIDPKGDVLAAEYKNEEALLVCNVDMQLVASYKDGGKHYYPPLRRNSLYE